MKKMLLVFGIFMGLSSCFLGAQGQKTAVLVIPGSKVQDKELLEVQKALETSGTRVLIAAPELKTVKGMLGGSFTPQITIAEIEPGTMDLLVIIGGTGSLTLWQNEALLAKVKALHSLGKPVSAICLASGVLAQAGVLEGQSATCFPLEKAIALLKEKGALYSTNAVVTAGKIITANGPEAAKAFGEVLVEVLKS